jgi:hypothetical protein
MIHFKITWTDGSEARKSYQSKEKLMQVLFEGKKSHFTSKVKRLEWVEKGIHHIEDVNSGEIRREVVGADTNPFGWRKEAEP